MEKEITEARREMNNTTVPWPDQSSEKYKDHLDGLADPLFGRECIQATERFVFEAKFTTLFNVPLDCWLFGTKG